MGARNMNRKPIRFIGLTAAAYLTFIVFWTGGLSYGFTLDKVLAVVDNDAITLTDYLLFAKSMDVGVSEHADVDKTLLKKLIEEKIILHEATRRGVEVTDAETNDLIEQVVKEGGLSQSDLEKELLKEGMNFKSYKKTMKERLAALKLIGTEVDSKVIVTDKEVEKFYRENREEYVSHPARAEVKAIFFKLDAGATVTEITDLKRKALKISAQLKNGQDFESLADRYNDEHLKERQGRLGEFQKGALIPELDRKVFSMQSGETSGPVWVKDGVYIVKLVNKTDAVFKPLEEVKSEIRKHLFAQRRGKLFNEWVKSLWEKAFVTIN